MGITHTHTHILPNIYSPKTHKITRINAYTTHTKTAHMSCAHSAHTHTHMFTPPLGGIRIVISTADGTRTHATFVH